MKGQGQIAPFQIRKADATDCAAILDCLGATFERYRNEYTAGAFADTVLDSESIERRLRDMCVLAAVADRQIVGTIGFCVNGAEGHLRGMAVLPAWQGTGLAAALLHAAENELRISGCAHVTLGTTEPLKRAIRFYETHGFLATGKVSNFFGMRLYEYSKSLDNDSEQNGVTE
jgi:GNAT superfamily N-acetyltransferase